MFYANVLISQGNISSLSWHIFSYWNNIAC